MCSSDLGRSLAPIPFGPSVYVATEAIIRFGSDAQKASWLPKLADGSAIGTFALSEKPGQNAAENVVASVSGGKLSGVKKIKGNEKEPGEWNKVEITLRGGELALAVNGEKVNEATGLDVVAGKIGLQSEGGEVHFRTVRLIPLADDVSSADDR